VEGVRFLQRRAFAAQWAAKNPVLGDGEFGIEKDTGIIKVGDGVTSWTELEPAFESQFLPMLGTAADSAKLGGNDPSFYLPASAASSFLPVGGTAADSDKLDGNDSLYFAKASDLPVYRRIAIGRMLSANDTIGLSDEGTAISFSVAGSSSLTIPTNATTPFPIGGWVDVQTVSASGPVTLSPAAGVVVLNQLTGIPFKCVMPYYITRLVKVAADQWYVLGVQDTGWIAMPGINGYTVGSDGANWRLLNGMVNFQIHCSASTAVAGAVFYTFPVGARPSLSQWFAAQFSQAFKGELKVTTAGAVVFGVANTAFVASGTFPIR
jgi:hypothetical protein